MSKMMYYNTRITTDTVICCKQDMAKERENARMEEYPCQGLHAPLLVLINCLKCFGAFITLNV